MATCGVSSGANKVYEAARQEMKNSGLDAVLTRTGCIGLCAREPLMDVSISGGPRLIYERVTAENARQIVRSLAAGKIPDQGALCRIRNDASLISQHVKTYDEGSNGLAKVPFIDEVPFFAKQVRVSLRNSGFIDPDSILEYIGRGGFAALLKVVSEMSPEQVIDEVSASGLRGRGGAGFPTGIKWKFCRDAKGERKYVICNADEGDPGAFMDRNILEGDPFSVIEGMIIGAYAIGADKGYIYCRAEYPLALKRLRAAIHEAYERGFLGQDITGKGFSFDLAVRAGAGAFVCGEETSLMASIEGTVGEPRTRPPFPAESGLWGFPTNINNVKTWSHIAPIIARGSSWYASMGTEKSRGTTVFSLVGKVQNTGLVEIPLGLSLREMIFEIGGGIPDGRSFKAVQTGGPSGGCIPEQFLDTAITYESLGELGSILGSGGMIVMDDSTCMVDLARFFISFTQDESCGKCTPCREGTRRMNQILETICSGEGSPEAIDDLADLASYVKETSLCGLGGTAPNPVLTTLKYFRQEYEAHVFNRQCSSQTCPRLVPASCQRTCPAGIDVPSYVALIAEGEYQQALDLIRKDNPLPAICGYVCNHPCESACERAQVDRAVAIKNLKRFVADWEMKNAPSPLPKKADGSLAKVAIVGSGPAGLTAAYFAALEGCAVTIYEAMDEPGGMLIAGIPEYRLPRDVIRYEIDRIKKLGVEIKTGVRVGKDIELEQLRSDGYQAVYLALGAYREMKLGLQNEEEVKGVVGSLEFLSRYNLGQKPRLEGRVVVIGGGNAAIDCARTALRSGPEEVTIVYRRTRDEMPADADEIAQALAEGVKLEMLASPVKLVAKAGKLSGIKCIRNELGAPDESGRRRPVAVAGSEFEIKAEILISAIGQSPRLDALAGVTGVKNDSRERVRIDPRTQQTDVDWIFAGGDVVTGPATVIEAVAAGRRAAKAMVRMLQNQELREQAPIPIPRMQVAIAKDMSDDAIAALTRPEMPTSDATKRKANFDLVELGFDEEMARKEAHRCLRCDVNR
ncbi:MAG: FAD-dependent oxidoreductase [Deltaproteobacteria bacterium]|nr:FAD-dependent oxidoreductase [Deltaproteobacteria bacterium]